MPEIKRIKATMRKMGIPENTLAKFDFAQYEGAEPALLCSFFDKMDELLSEEERLLVMQEQGCCKSGKRDKAGKAFAKQYSDKSIAERLALFPTVENMMSPVLNEDGSITVTMKGWQNGVHTGKTTCSCSTIKKLKQPFSVSSTYCGCCAGHFRYHYQNMLGVRLKLRSIDSSPLNTAGEAACRFTFEIEG